ncbi:MAG: FtsQ-type POTRA domain-containing protein [Gemmatimonadaceae bacterium]
MSERVVGEAVPPSPPRLARWKLALGAVLVVGILASPLWGPKVLRELAFFRVRKIEVLGARYTPPADVIERLHVDSTRSVWDPLGPLVTRVETHPQVEHVTITRKLPGTLIVELTERRPVALVQGPDGLRAVDERGKVLPLDPSRTPVDAPIVMAAPRDTVLYHLLSAMLREAPRFYARVSTITRSGADEIVIQVADIPVRAMTSVTLARLSDIEPVERDLARRQLHPAELDIRYRDQVIARLP